MTLTQNGSQSLRQRADGKRISQESRKVRDRNLWSKAFCFHRCDVPVLGGRVGDRHGGNEWSHKSGKQKAPDTNILLPLRE